MNKITGAVSSFLKTTDFSNLRDEQYSPCQGKRDSMTANALDFTFEGISAVPGPTSFFGGTLGMAWGVIKMFYGVAEMASRTGGTTAAGKAFLSGATSIGLGAAAVFLPGIGSYLNGAALVRDGADIINEALTRG